jgi:hypothetical protein
MIQALCIMERKGSPHLSMFTQFDQPSQTFMSFAAQFLSNCKSDTNNNPAFSIFTKYGMCEDE